jgi:uncharacterized membrane protein
MRAILARLRNHIVTGFIFIMPVLITVAVIMKFWTHLLKVGRTTSKLLFVDTVLGPSGDAVMAVVFFLLICVAAGYLVRISFLKRMGERIDQRLGGVIPGYSQLRAETKKKIGADGEPEARFEACLVKVQDLWQPGYLIEQNHDGTATVFVPQVPAVALGQVYVVRPGQLKRLGIDSSALNGHLRQLGKGMMATPVGPAMP